MVSNVSYFWMEFQVISFHSGDEAGNDDEEEEEERQYKIYLFGRDENGNSVSLETEFNPYFFIEIPELWTDATCQNFKIKLENVLGKSMKSSLLKCDKVYRKKFYGFTNSKMFPFIRLLFKTRQCFTRAMYTIKQNKIFMDNQRFKTEIFEYNFDPMLRFCHVQEVRTAGWVAVKNFKQSSEKKHNADIQIKARWQDIVGSSREDISPIIQASFDIETYSPDGSFPDPLNPECYVIQIATTFQRYGEQEPYKRSLLNLSTCDNIDGVELQCFSSEKTLLDAWSQLIIKEDPDILIGYNIWGFDLWYMWERSKITKALKFPYISKQRGVPTELKLSTFSSSAYGDNDYKMLPTIGRLQIDLLVIIKREHKLTKYSLNAVSEHFLKDKKVDLTPKEMFAKFRGNSTDRHDIGVYCVKDTDLPLKLMNKLAIIPNMIEMAKATWVPMSFLVERGQAIKVFSQLIYQTRKEKMLIKTFEKNNGLAQQDAYEGATVLQAKKGAYMESPITGLDFASLYPTIMRAHNLCPSTLVENESLYGKIDDITYEVIDGFKFAQNEEGIVPKLLANLAKNRKAAKKEMAKAEADGNYFMKAVYNGKQLAFKVSMNSIYGFMGATLGMCPCKPVAACTTSIGRRMIDDTKRMVEEWYPGADVVYGDTDSVMVKFDTGELKGKDALDMCFKLGNEAADRISATFKSPIELEFEKVYYPYLLFSKKRYAGLMYTNPKTSDYIDAKGIQLVRRDNCPFVKKVSQKVLDLIMYDLDTQTAIECAKQATRDILWSRVNTNDLIVSKSMKRIVYDYSNPTANCPFTLKNDYANGNQPHLTVAAKIESREPGSGPKSGDRVPYVFIDTGNPKDLQYLKAEDPDYVIANNVPIDSMYYIEHALMSPLESLFSLLIENPKRDIFEVVIEDYFVSQQIEILDYLDN